MKSRKKQWTRKQENIDNKKDWRGKTIVLNETSRNYKILKHKRQQAIKEKMRTVKYYPNQTVLIDQSVDNYILDKTNNPISVEKHEVN